MSAHTGLAQTKDEQAIRQLVDKFLTASKTDDTDTVLSLMSDDVVFMVPGMEPFGKKEFAANATKNRGSLIEAISDIKEIKILGDWAWMRNHLRITVRTPDNQEQRRSGYTLTILQKNRDGAWVICRDANLLTPEKPQ